MINKTMERRLGSLEVRVNSRGNSPPTISPFLRAFLARCVQLGGGLRPNDSIAMAAARGPGGNVRGVREKLSKLFLDAEALLDEVQKGNPVAVAQYGEKLKMDVGDSGRNKLPTVEPDKIPAWDSPRNPLEIRNDAIGVKRDALKELEQLWGSQREWLEERCRTAETADSRIECYRWTVDA